MNVCFCEGQKWCFHVKTAPFLQFALLSKLLSECFEEQFAQGAAWKALKDIFSMNTCRHDPSEYISVKSAGEGSGRLTALL